LHRLLITGCFALAVACRTPAGKPNSAEQEALAKLDAEADAEPSPFAEVRAPIVKGVQTSRQKQLIEAPVSASASDGENPSSAQCYEFKFFNQRNNSLKRDPVTLCRGDVERQIYLQSAQGRVAILNLSPDALVDPVAGITYVSARKLLCYDHNLPPNVRHTWTGSEPVVNCCSDVSFSRSESGNEAAVIFGRVEGPPSNCGQD